MRHFSRHSCFWASVRWKVGLRAAEIGVRSFAFALLAPRPAVSVGLALLAPAALATRASGRAAFLAALVVDAPQAVIVARTYSTQPEAEEDYQVTTGEPSELCLSRLP